ncbi:MAG TPA: helix-turn-helix domain-containing protein [Polyangia bacterium]|jgi:excisionase family DNA binding protein|nr:helix-turn-helix domain-containing protein [Polyangia bacterium]
MSIDADALASLFAALAAIPPRLAALERENAETRATMDAIRAALPPALLTVPAAAQAFKVSVPTMRRWVKAGEVPTVKVGNTIRVDLSRLHGTDDFTIARLARASRTDGSCRG